MIEYTKKSLSQKLGLKENQKIILLNMPEDYGHLLHPLPAGVSIYDSLQPEADFIQFFTTDFEKLDKEFNQIKSYLKMNGSLWISWKKSKKNKQSYSSSKQSEPPVMSLDYGGSRSKYALLEQSPQLNESIVREIGLRYGLVDVKVIAVDDTWSALKFVYRLKDRKLE